MPRTAALRLSLAACLAAAALLAPAPVLGDSAGSGSAPVSRRPVPILLYHGLGTPPAGIKHPSIWVRPREFAAEVRALRRAGYQAVTLQRVWDAWHGRATLPRRPVVFSFDDGYASQLRIALPVLRRERWPGVLNLALSYLDELGGAAAVQRLIDAGWEIDAHSRTHPDLTVLSDERLTDEVATAREEIRTRFGVEANFFCYPGGRFDARVVAAVRQAGYLAATTVRSGFATPAAPYALARVTVERGLGAGKLERRLRKLRSRAVAR